MFMPVYQYCTLKKEVKTMNKLFFQQQKINILNELINFSLVKIARKYLELLKDNRKINTNEIILEVLDSSVYLSEKDIDITDKKFLKKDSENLIKKNEIKL